MRFTTILLLALALLSAPAIATAEATAADSLATPSIETLLSESASVSSTEASGPNACGVDGDVQLKQNGELASQSCGACSTSNCNGAIRGQLCWLGWQVGGWGNCNIYLGNLCSTGGWKCRCLSGPIP